MEKFRNLKANEIMVRPTDTKFKGSALLLCFKDARIDMQILDDTVGQENWQKRFYDVKGNLYCSVGIRINDEWIWKDDCGMEGNMDAAKSEASDAFKRACFNWGIGRELYTVPKIKIKCPDNYYFNEKFAMTFTVSEIEFDENKQCTKLVIVDRFGNVVFNWSNGKQDTVEQPSNFQEAKLVVTDRISPQLYGIVCDASSLDYLKQIWDQNPLYHNNKVFKNLVSKRKKQLQTAS